MLILICEASQIFVWRNNVFIFFQKSDIVEGPDTGVLGALFAPTSPTVLLAVGQ